MKRFELYGKLEYIPRTELNKDWVYLGIWEDLFFLPWKIYKNRKTKEIRYTNL